jgi:hypothetical protein
MDRCYCGRDLKNKWGYVVCPEHGACWRNAPIKPPKREKIGKYSGKSKRPYGQYERDFDEEISKK